MVYVDHIGLDSRSRLARVWLLRERTCGLGCSGHRAGRGSEDLSLNLDSIFETLPNDCSKRGEQQKETDDVGDDSRRHQQASGNQYHDPVCQSRSGILPAAG